MVNAETTDIKDDIPLLVQNLIGDQKSSSQQLTLTRAEAALFLWNLSVLSKSRRAVIDAGAVVPMCALLKAGAVTQTNIHGRDARTAREERSRRSPPRRHARAQLFAFCHMCLPHDHLFIHTNRPPPTPRAGNVCGFAAGEDSNASHAYVAAHPRKLQKR